jgi:protein-S-isoprenylcysteine O-methyltransferase Ste14
LVVWLGSAIQLLIAWREERLLKTGFYALFINPLYVAFILFIFPALSLLLNNWLYLGLSVVFLVAMKLLVGKEYDFLEKKYGDEYREYRKKVLIKV